jgi:hypothetical protein
VHSQRCVELIIAAAGHGVDEAWIAKHPVLTLAYILQLMPSLGWRLLKKVRKNDASMARSVMDLKPFSCTSHEFEIVPGLNSSQGWPIEPGTGTVNKCVAHTMLRVWHTAV